MKPKLNVAKNDMPTTRVFMAVAMLWAMAEL